MIVKPQEGSSSDMTKYF